MLADLSLAYRLRWKRRRFLLRVLRKRKQLCVVTDRTKRIGSGDILSFSTVRNEAARLPFFLNYYRNLGVDHFLMVDNSSDDGTADYLADQPDVSLWSTPHSYRLSRFGLDWLGWLQLKYGHGHWCLTVDADELLVYPRHEACNLRDLTDWLDCNQQPSLGTLMIDLYPKGALADETYEQGEDPLNSLQWFDAEGHRTMWHPIYDNLWIQGGVRDRVFFASNPRRAPTINKTPLVRWDRRFAYVSSTHQLLPRRLHDVFGDDSKEKLTGALLHTKFLPMIVQKSAEELRRKEHFENSALYTGYHEALTKNPILWHSGSSQYKGWKQLVDLGLMSQGDWD